MLKRDSPTLAALVFTLLFAASAAVQLNDPDPAEWIALYTAGALVSLASAFRRSPPALQIGVGLIAACWGAWLMPSVVREAAFTWNEIERELGGLTLVALAMVYLYRNAPRSTPSDQ